MIDLITQNESLINLVSIIFLVVGFFFFAALDEKKVDLPSDLTGLGIVASTFFAILVVVGFSMLLLSTMLNGMVKGF